MSLRASLVNVWPSLMSPAGLRHRALAEGGELLLGEAVEVLLRLDLVPDHRLLVAREARIEGALAGCRVDVDHRRDQLRDDVARGIAGEPRRAVEREHGRRRAAHEGVDDRVDVVREGDAGPVRVLRLEPGQRQGGDVVAVGPQQRGDLVPRPRAEPETRDQDDRCARHVVAPPVLVSVCGPVGPAQDPHGAQRVPAARLAVAVVHRHVALARVGVLQRPRPSSSRLRSRGRSPRPTGRPARRRRCAGTRARAARRSATRSGRRSG